MEVCRQQGYSYEVIIGDDGSTDHTGAVVKELGPVTYNRLRGIFGQTGSLDSGIKQAEGTLTVTMDGDGQNITVKLIKTDFPHP